MAHHILKFPNSLTRLYGQLNQQVAPPSTLRVMQAENISMLIQTVHMTTIIHSILTCLQHPPMQQTQNSTSGRTKVTVSFQTSLHTQMQNWALRAKPICVFVQQSSRVQLQNQKQNFISLRKLLQSPRQLLHHVTKFLMI